MKSTSNFNTVLIHPALNLSGSRMQRQSAKERNAADAIILEYYLEQSNEKKDNPERAKLYIKNMVCNRCKIVVKDILENLGLHYTNVELGEVEIAENLPEEKREELKIILPGFGLELIEDEKNLLVERIKNIVIDMIHYSDELPKIKLSVYLSKKLNHHYNYLYRVFSDIKGMTIQHYVLSHKIERAKELMLYDELTLSEIAYKLDYSSVAHLSNQFKKITGLTPSHFREMKEKKLIALENL